MLNLPFFILVVSAMVYGVSFLLHLSSFRNAQRKNHRRAFTLMRLGFLLSTFYFAAEAMQKNVMIPVAGLSEALAFFAWSLAFVYLVLLARAQSDSFGLILTPVLLFLTSGAILTSHPGSVSFPLPQNPFFMVHILSAFFAYACYAISFAASVLYLIQNHELKSKQAGTFYHQLPSLEELEKLIYQPMIWGTCLLMSAVMIGFLWSKSAYGVFWMRDPKTVSTVATTLVYFVILYLRFVASLRAKKGAVLTLAAFILVLFSFVGTRFIEGSHNYLQ